MSLKKRIVFGVLGAAIVAAVVWGFWPTPPTVEADVVAYGPMTETVESEGVVHVRDRYTVTAPVTGYVRRLRVEVGDVVRTGQTLAELQPAPPSLLDDRMQAEAHARARSAEDLLREAHAHARAAAAQASLAASDLRRVGPLAADSILAPMELDRYVAEARRTEALRLSAEQAVAVAGHNLEQAQAALRTPRPGGRLVALTSPATGVVITVHRESEGIIGAGTPLVEVGNPSDREVVADVLSDDAVRLEPGMRAQVLLGQARGPFEGRVRRVEPVAATKVSALGVEEQRVRVHVSVPELSGAATTVGEGYHVRVRFVLWENPRLLRVPASALFEERPGRWALYVVEAGRARRRNVAIGAQSGAWTEVQRGLRAGDRVIAHPGRALRDGLRVRH